MISRTFERPECTAKRANDTSNRYRMRHMGSQDASASCLVSAHDRILGTHRVDMPSRSLAFTCVQPRAGADPVWLTAGGYAALTCV